MIKSALRQSLALTLAAILLGAAVNTIRPHGIAWVRPEIPVLVSESEGDSTDTADSPSLVVITLEQAKTFFAQGMPFIDAREWDYYREGHIAGAFPVDNYMALVFTLDSLQGREAPLVTYCDGDECGSSEELAYDLQASGFSNIYIFRGGWSAWKQAGLPIEP